MYAKLAENCIMDWNLLNNVQKFILDWNFEKILPQIYLHSGRIDANGGHRDWLNRSGLGFHHFHHGQPAHLHPDGNCPHESLETFIINPYTGNQIALGRPLYFEDEPYFSLNLVSKALQIHDGLGVDLGLNNRGGSFWACNLGESSTGNGTLGERFSFFYPTNIFGLVQNNTLFFTGEGSRSGRLELLCHTRQSPLDTTPCYAYVSLETIMKYMLAGNFFTRFSPDNGNIWNFRSVQPIRGIISPQEDENFQVEDMIIVRVQAQDVSSATLAINGQTIETKTGFQNQNIVEFNYVLTESELGTAVIRVQARNNSGRLIVIPPIRIQVTTNTFSIAIVSPKDGDIFYVGDTVIVAADIKGATHAELIIGDHHENLHNLYQHNNISFTPYILRAEDMGNRLIDVTVQGENGEIVSDTIKIVVSPDYTQITMEEAIKNALRLTHSFEGADFSTVAGNFDNQGISFGMLQWNIGSGTLQPLLKEMHNHHPQIMSDVFGYAYQEIVSMLDMNLSQQLSWAIGINNTRNQIVPEWTSRFVTLGNTPEFQQIQIDAQEDWINQGISIFNNFELTTERGLALSIDIAVQNWTVRAGTSIISDTMTEIQRMIAMTNSVVEQSSSSWQDAVRARKETIVNGIGFVNGRNYDIYSEFGIGDRVVSK